MGSFATYYKRWSFSTFLHLFGAFKVWFLPSEHSPILEYVLILFPLFSWALRWLSLVFTAKLNDTCFRLPWNKHTPTNTLNNLRSLLVLMDETTFLGWNASRVLRPSSFNVDVDDVYAQASAWNQHQREKKEIHVFLEPRSLSCVLGGVSTN